MLVFWGVPFKTRSFFVFSNPLKYGNGFRGSRLWVSGVPRPWGSLAKSLMAGGLAFFFDAPFRNSFHKGRFQLASIT